MAISREGPLISQISGTLGSSVFYQGARAGVIGTRPRRHNTQTYESTKRRRAILQAETTWRAQSDDFKQLWRTFAASFPWWNRLGIRRPLSGYQAFLSYTMTLSPYGETVPLAATPPSTLTSPVPQITAAAFTWNATQTITVEDLPPADTNEHLIIRRMLQYGPRTAPGMTRAAGTITREDLEQDWSAQISINQINLLPGELIQLRIYWVTPGFWPSLRNTFNTTVI
jgi:hypothetical protein